MSRVGKKPILIPEGVEVKSEDGKVFVKGPKGEVQISIRPEILVKVKGKEILAISHRPTKKTNAFWGTTRALVANMVKGVTQGYEKRLQIEGVGYKARVEGDEIILNVGFSHPVKIKQPQGIKFSVEKNIIIIVGIDKGLVGQMAAKIRAIKPPEPYKGKGIRYFGEIVKKKAGKKVVATAG